MPLRAKITNRQMASQADVPKELPGDDPEDVLFNKSYNIRTIELNRPKKLNSLDGSMCRKIIPRLLAWAESDMVTAVIMKGAGDKALCAGGDVATLAKWNQEGPEGRQRSKEYFSLEYKLDHLIATYTKPYIAFMDGITMGGGVGLSIHAPFRIATERTLFAMPETSIGFFPEVGASFFLPRMDGQLGKYLGLTSERLKGVQTYYHGIATHYIHSSSLPDLENRLAELSIPDYTSMQDRLVIINNTIAEFVAGLPHDQPMQLSGDIRKAIDRCFASGDISEIFAALKAEQEPRSSDQAEQDQKDGIVRQPKWAEKTIEAMSGRSPTSLKVTLRQQLLGKKWNIGEAFEREEQIAWRFMDHPDFTEGVSAKLLRKPPTDPKWQPAAIDDVSDADVDHMFTSAEGARRIQLLNPAPKDQYSQYPHAWTGLPTETAVKDFVSKRGDNARADSIVQHFFQQSNGKPGVKEVVTDILKRQTAQTSGGTLSWIGP